MSYLKRDTVTFTSHQELNKIITLLFKDYYSRSKLELPFDMELREFAYQPFGKDTYVRHLSFGSEKELLDYITHNIPLHLFFSSAKYQIPSADDMELKGWIGADLQFDIDADEICNPKTISFCPICGKVLTNSKCEEHGIATTFSEITGKCLSKALEQALTIKDILKDDFALDSKIYFSGNRGFHVYVECSGDCALMDSEERKQIVDYISGKCSQKFKGGRENDPGWIGRLAKGIEKTVFDEQVTIDVKRLVRIPGSIHGKSGLIVKKVESNNFSFDSSLCPFAGSAIFFPLITGEFQLLDSKVKMIRGDPIKLDVCLAIYAHLKGLGEVKLYVR
ncbi:DNA primase small subunit PriS [Acidianus sp. DSM 29099]|nr:DNA primase small subunit PriS [Acidianus sp. RZ1]